LRIEARDNKDESNHNYDWWVIPTLEGSLTMNDSYNHDGYSLLPLYAH